MEVLGILFGVGLILGIPLLGLVGFIRSFSLSRRIDALEAAARAEGRLVGSATGVPPPPAAQAPAPAPPVRRVSSQVPTTVGVPTEKIPEPPPTERIGEPPPTDRLPGAPPTDKLPEPPETSKVLEPIGRPPVADMATNLGPKIMAGVAAIFVVTALAFFVKYAWDNNWVGPAGRVLGSALFSLMVFAIGMKALGREYRPLGQALMATGLAGLYVVAYAAHGVYQLIPATPAFGLMVAVTAAAVLLAIRLDARLLAALAWIGAYLAPVLISTGEDRAESLFAYLALLAAGALVVDRRRAWPETLVLAQAGTWILYGGWFTTFAKGPRFTVAAAGLLLFTALFALGPRRTNWPSTLAALLIGSVWMLGAFAQDAVVVGIALLGLGAIGALAIERFAGSTLVTLVIGWAAAFSWFSEAGHTEALVVRLAATVFVFYLAVLIVRGKRMQEGTGGLGATAGQVLNAAAFWLALFGQWYPAQLWPLTFATVGLAAVYLVLGRLAPAKSAEMRTLVGLGAAFLTAAIPIRLGLNGITVAWAVEGVLLLWLGLRNKSILTRFGGYAVLLLALGRLFSRHLPIHPWDQGFTPVMNASFGVWMFTALCFGAAYRVVRGIEEDNRRLLARWLLAAAAVLVLFVAMTAETSSFFGLQQRLAMAAQDQDGARRAALLGGLSISLLWSAFASALLVAGLSFRSRAVFYSAYGLFAVTAAKVVLVDLSDLQTLYRILSFLALGVLLMVGAFLIMRFRHRLDPPAPTEGTT